MPRKKRPGHESTASPFKHGHRPGMSPPLPTSRLFPYAAAGSLSGQDPTRPSPYPLYPLYREPETAFQHQELQLQIARYQQQVAVAQAAQAAQAAAQSRDEPPVRRRPSLLPPGGLHDWSEHNGTTHSSRLEAAAAAAAAAAYGRGLYPAGLVEQQAAVAAAAAAQQQQQQQGPDPHKRPRLSQLVIDTSATVVKKEPAYIPQVEAISPTLPEERSSKDELQTQITRLATEISQVEMTMMKLRKKQSDLEAHENRKGADGEDGAAGAERQMSPAQIIYADNRKKAQAAHALLNGFGPKLNLPMYNQPSDTAVYHENKKKYASFKNRLIAFLKQRQQETSKRDEYLSKHYTHQMGLWIKKQERHIGNKSAATARRQKDQKLREFFEKQFPELKKQREERERFSRAGQRVRSDAEMEEIMDGIQQQEDEEKRMRSYAVVPPRLLDRFQRKNCFRSENSRVDDFATDYKELQSLTHWTDQEKLTFREKYVQFPKNFGQVSSFLERKTTADCVNYYYMSKKRENYKRLVRKHNARKRTRNNLTSNRGNQSSASTSSATNMITTTVCSSLPQRRQLSGGTSSSSNNTNISGGNNNASNSDKNGPISSNECALCKCSLNGNASTTEGDTASDEGESRLLTRANCDLYGLTEEQLAGSELRVCAECRFKTEDVTVACPMPNCEQRVRRLRVLPAPWLEQNSDLSIPNGVLKCCSSCFEELNCKKLINSHDHKADVWSHVEIENMRRALRTYGTDWAAVASVVVSKSRQLCKHFYMTNKRRLNLHHLVNEFRKAEGKDEPLSEVEDEPPLPPPTSHAKGMVGGASSFINPKDDGPERRHSTSTTSDTASACSPKDITDTDGNWEGVEGAEGHARERKRSHHTHHSGHHRSTSESNCGAAMDGYDSSATVSADEGESNKVMASKGTPPSSAPSVAPVQVSRPPPVLTEQRNLDSSCITSTRPPSRSLMHSLVVPPPVIQPPQLTPGGMRQSEVVGVSTGHQSVRDLIFQTIEASFQPASASNSHSVAAQSSALNIRPKPAHTPQTAAADFEVQTLDLSKKPARSTNSPQISSMEYRKVTTPTRSGVDQLRYSTPPPAHSNSYRAAPTPPPTSSSRKSQQPSKPGPPPLISKQFNMPLQQAGGSITHGTSSIAAAQQQHQQQQQQQAFNAVGGGNGGRHSQHSFERKDGSITLGTPNLEYKKVTTAYEQQSNVNEQYYRAAAAYAAGYPSGMPGGAAAAVMQHQAAAAAAGRGTSQLLIDFNTSKQMQQRKEKERETPPVQYQAPPGHAFMPPPMDRQNVIRWPTSTKSVIQAPPGKSRSPSTHDPFQTLVNAAAAQPSLIIPPKEHHEKQATKRSVEGLEKSLLEMHGHLGRTNAHSHGPSALGNSSSNAGSVGSAGSAVSTSNHPSVPAPTLQHHPVVPSSQMRLLQGRTPGRAEPFSKEQFEKEMRQSHRTELDNEASRMFSASFAKDPPKSSGLTAANLIDAIITHQINLSDPKSLAPSFAPSSSSGNGGGIVGPPEKLPRMEPPTSQSSTIDQAKDQGVSLSQHIAAMIKKNITNSVPVDPSPESWKLRKALTPQSMVSTGESLGERPPSRVGRAPNISALDYMKVRIEEAMREPQDRSPRPTPTPPSRPSSNQNRGQEIPESNIRATPPTQGTPGIEHRASPAEIVVDDSYPYPYSALGVRLGVGVSVPSSQATGGPPGSSSQPAHPPPPSSSSVNSSSTQQNAVYSNREASSTPSNSSNLLMNQYEPLSDED